jgi:phosphoribosyl 1,2-cyclic phosphate phosphodiesterase
MAESMSAAPIKITVLGSGTSMGVPTLGCHCRVCSSKDPRDNRLRPSLLVSRAGQNVVIDTTPDFRQQALRAGIDRLDAILLTHGHADHILGFDDIRPYNIRQKSALPVYSNEETFATLRRAFSYVFDNKPTLSTVPSVKLHVIQAPFEVLGVPFIPIPLAHGPMEVLGFRFANAAYLTDFSNIPDASLALLENLDELIIDALRDMPHPMHQTVEQALALVQKLNPKRAWFTHIAHDLSHAETNERLRKLGFPNVHLAYDGLELEVPIGRSETISSLRETRATTSPPPVATENPDIPKVRLCDSSRAWHESYAGTNRGSVLAIGNFDGIHLGHQAILRANVERANESGAVATALTFDPPPLKLLRPETAPLRLSTSQQRMEWFAAVGLEAVVVLPFTLELSRLSPTDFVEQILVNDLRVKTVLVGENFRFGHRQAGNVKLLRELGQRHAFEVAIIPPVMFRGEIVSSTMIRRAISDGDVCRAGRLLGRPFVLSGPIVKGTGTGSKFTFPTLNLQPDQELLPGRGVYITRTYFPGLARSVRSVTNVGMRPTFHGTALTIETHVLDRVPDTAPKHIAVRFWKRLRAEKKFGGPEELRMQIARDIAQAGRFFSLLRRMRTRHSFAETPVPLMPQP